MTRLAADAYVIPCDGTPELTRSWERLVAPSQEPASRAEWFRPKDVTLVDGLAVVDPAVISDGERPKEIGGVRVLIDTVSPGNRLEALVDCALHGVRKAGELARAHAGRARPLVAIPLLGVGAGLFPGKRADVVRALIRELYAWVSADCPENERHYDVALVLYRTADYAAAQWQRALLDKEADCWPELDAHLKEHADRLGDLAARGNLSVFAGAGVSMPLGFPSWKALLQSMADKAGVDIDLAENADYPAIGEKLRKQLPDFDKQVADLFTTDRHALSHALLACLRTRTMVTTNYDPCLENAAERVHEPPGPRVLARQLAEGDKPWLLKLHGDVARPDSIILASSQYDSLKNDRQALRGVVQTLMLTSHLLFVGFGFAKSDFSDMYAAVSQARALATEAGEGDTAFGTTITLKPEGDHRHPEITSLSTGQDGDQEASRRLEILLDRVAWAAQVNGPQRAAYVLDPAYEASASPHDLEVRRAVEALTKVAQNEPASPVNSVVIEFRRRLGLS